MRDASSGAVACACVFAMSVGLAALCDAFARPRDLPGGADRMLPRGAGVLVLALADGLVFGAALGLTGRPVAAGALALVLTAVCVGGSNVKRALLGEALIFSDLAIIRACLRHPRFYVSAVAWPARGVLLAGIAGSIAAVAFLFARDLSALRIGGAEGRLAGRCAGIAIMAASWGLLRRIGRSGLAARMAPTADLEAAVARYGLLASLALGWLRWREDIARPSRAARPPLGARGPQGRPASGPGWGPGPIVVVIQCESFADPRDLGLDPVAVPAPGHLRDARRHGRHGALDVSGFGAYTMRTEFGVLFGIEEDALGFERFDPYLSAARHASHALPARLAPLCAERVFIHPYDLRFYRRDRLMPAIGFTETVGGEAFADAPRHGPHVDDRALGAYLRARIEAAATRAGGTLLHAVSIENHGPWRDGVAGYARHLAHGDAMLGEVAEALRACERPAVLAFYGDHRPTLPGVTHPGSGRTTPFVLRVFQAPAPETPGPEVLTPAGLHHAILDAVRKLMPADLDSADLHSGDPQSRSAAQSL